MMTKRFLRSILGSLFVLALGASPAAAQTWPLRIDVPSVPPTLEVPDGHVVFLEGHAVGTQNYVCLPAPSGATWVFLAPQATLFQKLWGGFDQQITTHFLSPNPAEAGIARPSWQHSFDSSQVWGRALASSLDPAYVEPGAIPWLLVEIVGARRGPEGGSLLSQTTFIQRLNTSGGRAPAGGCATVGAVVLVPYTTDYFFYRARRK